MKTNNEKYLSFTEKNENIKRNNFENVKIYIDGEAVPLSKLVRLWQMHQETYKGFKKLVSYKNTIQSNSKLKSK